MSYIQKVDVASGTVTATPDTALNAVVPADDLAFLTRPEPSGLAISRGLHSNYERVTKFGRSTSISNSTWTPVALGELYQTPQPAGATTLRVKAGNGADTAAGAGARTVTIEGLDETGAFATETLTTNGAAAGTPSTTTFMRLFRAYVASSGTYANVTTGGSHVGDIVIENGTGGTDWITIDSTGFARGQTECAFYSVPLGKTAFVASLEVQVEGNQQASFIFFQRLNITEPSAPFTARRSFVTFEAVRDVQTYTPTMPIGPIVGPADLGIVSLASTNNTSVDAIFDIYLVDT